MTPADDIVERIARQITDYQRLTKRASDDIHQEILCKCLMSEVEATRFNLQSAAVNLGLSRKTLYERMMKFNLGEWLHEGWDKCGRVVRHARSEKRTLLRAVEIISEVSGPGIQEAMALLRAEAEKAGK